LDTAALIGSGHSLRDLHEPWGLCQNRYTLGMNLAAYIVPDIDEVYICDANVTPLMRNALKPHHTVVVNKGLHDLITSHVHYHRANEWLLEHGKLTVHRPQTEHEAMTLVICFALDYLWGQGYRKLELYGVDLDQPNYGNGKKMLRHFGDRGMEIVNCCPSSPLGLFSKEERPWAKLWTNQEG